MPPTASPGFARREIILGIVLTLGVLGGLAYSAYRKSRDSSQEKVVLCVVRQLSAAADQYYLENGVSTVALNDLVGATNYIKAISPLAGETYPLRYTRGVTITVTGIAGVRTVTYAP